MATLQADDYVCRAESIDTDDRQPPVRPGGLHALENWRAGARRFDAHLSFERQPISSASLARVLATDPLATLRVTSLIHWQALKLWRKRAPVYDRPAKRDAA